jgi:hypothetical protein
MFVGAQKNVGAFSVGANNNSNNTTTTRYLLDAAFCFGIRGSHEITPALIHMCDEQIPTAAGGHQNQYVRSKHDMLHRSLEHEVRIPSRLRIYLFCWSWLLGCNRF